MDQELSSGKKTDEARNLFLLAQYNQIYNEKRYFDQAMWQIPSVVMAVSSVIFAVALNYVHVLWVSGTILLFGAIFDLSLAVVLTKHRINIDSKSKFLEDFEKKYNLEYLPYVTKDIIKYLDKDKSWKHETNDFFRNRNAFQWTFHSMIGLVAVLAILGIYKFIGQFIPAIILF